MAGSPALVCAHGCGTSFDHRRVARAKITVRPAAFLGPHRCRYDRWTLSRKSISTGATPSNEPHGEKEEPRTESTGRKRRSTMTRVSGRAENILESIERDIRRYRISHRRSVVVFRGPGYSVGQGTTTLRYLHVTDLSFCESVACVSRHVFGKLRDVEETLEKVRRNEFTLDSKTSHDRQSC